MKNPKVQDAEITEDGALVVKFNRSVLYPQTKQVIFTPEALHAIAEDYGVMPEPDENDFPGIPIVTEEAIYEEEKDGKKKARGH